MGTMFLTKLNNMRKSYRGPSIDTSRKILLYLATQFDSRRFLEIDQPDSFGQVVSEKIFFNRPTRKKNCLWLPCLLTDRDEMSNLYRGPSIDVYYQVSVHLTKRNQRNDDISSHGL
jgi:hypothetical protein